MEDLAALAAIEHANSDRFIAYLESLIEDVPDGEDRETLLVCQIAEFHDCGAISDFVAWDARDYFDLVD